MPRNTNGEKVYEQGLFINLETREPFALSELVNTTLNVIANDLEEAADDDEARLLLATRLFTAIAIAIEIALENPAYARAALAQIAAANPDGKAPELGKKYMEKYPIAIDPSKQRKPR